MKTVFLLISCALLLTGCGQKSGAQLDTADEKDARVRCARVARRLAPPRVPVDRV